MIPIEIDAIFFQEGTTCVGYCPELDVSSCGHDVEEARRNLRTAVRLFVEEAEKMGTLEGILREAGYQKQSDQSWRAPRLLSTEIMSLGV
jgi:predicted RNase H-like HicB family nuclease